MNLRALLVEDSVNDALLLEHELRRGGYDPVVKRVDTRDAFAHALAHESWDIVISDYALPAWSGMDALVMLNASGKDLPFILISGAIGEEIAVDAIKAGASDYLLKDRLARLPSAVARALEQAELRRVRRRSEAALAFLEQASLRLSRSLDRSAIVDALLELAVPVLADAARLDLVAETGQIRRLSTRSLAGAIALDDGADLGDPLEDAITALVTHVVRDGARTTCTAVHVGDAPPLSLLAIALTARGAVLGVVTLVRSPAVRTFAAPDQSLAEEFIRRASVAFENARLYARAREAIAARDEFMLIASHELKTPLTPLVMHLRTVARAATTDPHLCDFGKNVTVMLNQVQRLTSLVDQLLDVSRLAVDRLELTLEHLDLAALVSDIVNAFRAQAADVGSALEVRASNAVRGRWDRARIGQLIENLLSNALKFGGGKPVDVTVERHGTSARVQIRDRGCGVAHADRARIFERFERAVSVRQYGGFGIGLWVAREIVHAHRGSISLSSEPGAGATFTIELPIDRSSAESTSGISSTNRT